MSLRTRYFLFIIILHIVLTVLLYLLLSERKLLFILSETGILLSLLVSYKLYQLFIYPFQLLESGKNAIGDEDFTIKYTKTGTQEMDALIKVYNDMIDRLRIEKTRTEEQSYFLENLVEMSPLGLIIMDYDKRIQIFNARSKAYLDCKDAIGKKLTELFHPLAMEISSMQSFEEKVISIDGLKKYKCQIQELIHKGFPRQFVLIEELTEEILEAEKHAYGKVIRMMAHEVNNSMGAVNSILENVKEYGFPNEEEDKELRHYIELAIERNKMLGKFTRNFADVIRLPKPILSKVDLNAIVTNIIGTFGIIAKEQNISFDIRIYTEPIIIHADKVQLEQALSNIIKNAIESIGSDREGGNIIATTLINPNKLIITDNGKGIDEESSKHLFTPFFSTKPTGQGIGLMLIRDILNNHHAEYKLHTDQNTKLTSFEIEFKNL